MTYQKALDGFKQLHGDIDKNNHLFVGTINPDFVQMAISALEKQIQKKPSLHDEPYPKHKTGTKSPFCPNCDQDLLDDANDCFRYCPDCGQAIDWSDDE